MGNFLYLFFNIALLIGACVLFIPLYKKEIKKNILLFIPVTLIVIPYDIFADSYGVLTKAWSFNSNRSFGYIPLGGAWDTILFAIVSGIIFVFLVSAFAEREEKKKSFWPF